MCHYITKEDLLLILEAFPDSLALLKTNFLAKQGLFKRALKLDPKAQEKEPAQLKHSTSLQLLPPQRTVSDTPSLEDQQKRQLFKTKQLNDVTYAHHKQEEFLSNFGSLSFDYKQTEIFKNCLEKLQKIDESFLPPPKKGETFRGNKQLNFDSILASARKVERQCIVSHLHEEEEDVFLSNLPVQKEKS